MIHMKCQALYSQKNKESYLKCLLMVNTAESVENIVDPCQMQYSAASNIGLQRLLRSIWLIIMDKNCK